MYLLGSFIFTINTDWRNQGQQSFQEQFRLLSISFQLQSQFSTASGATLIFFWLKSIWIDGHFKHFRWAFLRLCGNSALWKKEHVKTVATKKQKKYTQNQIVSLHLPKFWKNKILVTFLLGCRRKCERSKNETRGIRRSWGTWFADMSLRWGRAEDMPLGFEIMCNSTLHQTLLTFYGSFILSVTQNTCCSPFLGTTRF